MSCSLLMARKSHALVALANFPIQCTSHKNLPTIMNWVVLLFWIFVIQCSIVTRFAQLPLIDLSDLQGQYCFEFAIRFHFCFQYWSISQVATFLQCFVPEVTDELSLGSKLGQKAKQSLKNFPWQHSNEFIVLQAFMSSLLKNL